MKFLQKDISIKEKFVKISITIISLKNWQLIVGAVITAELFTFILNSLQSLLWWSFWSPELIMIGTIDALFVAGVMAPLLIVIAGQITKYQEYKKKAEAEAKLHAVISEEEKKFKLYVENSTDTVSIIDSFGYFTYESPSVKKNYGYETVDLIGKSVFEFIHPDDIKFALDAFSNVVRVPYFEKTIEVRFLRKDGTWAHVRTSGKNMIDNPDINGIILNNVDITQRVEIENQLTKSIKEKETLMKEIHHRVKNNFMTVSSLLYLQSEISNDPKITEILTECQNRVRSMALIHEKLYQSETFTEIDVNGYLQRLVSFIQSSYVIGSEEITINLDIDTEIRLVPGRAISLGLIINELLSNTFKYAFPSTRNGIVDIKLFQKLDQYFLTVKDNGVGFPEGYDLSNSTSLGLKLVQMMTEQVKGKFSVNRNGGTEFKIIFPT